MTTIETYMTTMPGYGTATDADVLSWLQESVQKNKDSMTGDEIFQATDAAQWDGLTDSQKNQWLAFCGRDSIDPFGAANVALVTAIFGGGSATVTALQALRQETVTRFEKDGPFTLNGQSIGVLTLGVIEAARA